MIHTYWLEQYRDDEGNFGWQCRCGRRGADYDSMSDAGEAAVEHWDDTHGKPR